MTPAEAWRILRKHNPQVDIDTFKDDEDFKKCQEAIRTLDALLEDEEDE